MKGVGLVVLALTVLTAGWGCWRHTRAARLEDPPITIVVGASAASCPIIPVGVDLTGCTWVPDDPDCARDGCRFHCLGAKPITVERVAGR